MTTSSTSALADHEYGHEEEETEFRPVVIPQRLTRIKAAEPYKWTEDETRRFLELRRKHIDKFYVGKRGNIQKTYAIILEEMGLLDKVTPTQARKKWNNMVQLYRRLLKQPRFDAGGGKEYVPMVSWPFFRDVEKTIQLEPEEVVCQPFEGTSLQELSDQINRQLIEVTFPTVECSDKKVEPPPPKRTKRDKEGLRVMIKELSQLHKKEEEILAAKNKLTIALLSQLVAGMEDYVS